MSPHFCEGTKAEPVTLVLSILQRQCPGLSLFGNDFVSSIRTLLNVLGKLGGGIRIVAQRRKPWFGVGFKSLGRSLFSEWFIFVLPFIRFLGKLDQRMGSG
jgi:hypothetical protein